MKELKLFMCEHCETQYKDKGKAKECENNRILPKEISDTKYHSMCDYPDMVLIKFSDGKVGWYKR